MRIDLYTKTILTLIALLLAVVALKPMIQPQPAMAQGNFSGIEFSANPGGNYCYFFDTHTGDVWAYSGSALAWHLKVSRLGKDLTK